MSRPWGRLAQLGASTAAASRVQASRRLSASLLPASEAVLGCEDKPLYLFRLRFFYCDKASRPVLSRRNRRAPVKFLAVITYNTNI